MCQKFNSDLTGMCNFLFIMESSKTIIRYCLFIVIFLPFITSAQNRKQAKKVIGDHFESKIQSGCGKTSFAIGTPGKAETLFEFKKPRFRLTKKRVKEMDRANGIQWKGYVVFKEGLHRTYSKSYDSYQLLPNKWVNGFDNRFLQYEIEYSNSQWNISVPEHLHIGNNYDALFVPLQEKPSCEQINLMISQND